MRVPGRNVRTKRHRAGADATRERRPDGQLLEPGLGGFALGLGRGQGSVERFDLCRQVIDLRAGSGAGSAEGLGAVELDRDFVLESAGAVRLGDGLLDFRAPLVGIELHEHVAGLDVLAFLEADFLDDACNPGSHGDGFEGTDRSDGFRELSTTRPVFTVSTSTSQAPSRHPRLPCPARRLRARSGKIAANHRRFRQIAALIGKPATNPRCSQQGDDGELTGHTHARSLKDDNYVAMLVAHVVPAKSDHTAAKTTFCITIS